MSVMSIKECDECDECDEYKESLNKSMKKYRDLRELRDPKEYSELKNFIDTAFIEGFKKGAIKIALKMIRRGDNSEEIAEITELPLDEVEKLRKSESDLQGFGCTDIK